MFAWCVSLSRICLWIHSEHHTAWHPFICTLSWPLLCWAKPRIQIPDVPILWISFIQPRIPCLKAVSEDDLQFLEMGVIIPHRCLWPIWQPMWPLFSFFDFQHRCIIYPSLILYAWLNCKAPLETVYWYLRLQRLLNILHLSMTLHFHLLQFLAVGLNQVIMSLSSISCNTHKTFKGTVMIYMWKGVSLF